MRRPQGTSSGRAWLSRVVRWLERALTRPGHTPPLLLTGPGRIGKSSFLRWLPRLLPDHLPLWIDGQTLGDAPDHPALLRRLIDSLHAAVQDRKPVLPALSPEQLAHDPSACFFQQLEALRTLHPGGRVLLCLDEYNALDNLLRSGRLEESFLAALRAFLQRSPWLSVLFAGRKGLEALDPRWSRHLNNFAQEHLSTLPRADAEALLSNPTGNKADFPVQIPPTELNAQLNEAGEHPFLIQAIGESLVEHLNEERRLEVLPEDVEPILLAVLRRQETAFRDWYNECTPEELDLMHTLAREGASPRAKWDNDEHGAALDRLLRDVLIAEKEGQLEIRIPLVKRFWQKQRRRKQRSKS